MHINGTLLVRVMQVGLGVYHLVLLPILIYALIAVWPESCSSALGMESCAGSSIFGLPLPISLETRLILLVVVAGAIGSFVHTATSLATYMGNRTLVPSWGWWYVLRAPIGSAVAVLIYFAFRGGLVDPKNAAALSVPGIVAISGLAGMFSKQAADKLRELFDNLFRVASDYGDAQREDKPK